MFDASLSERPLGCKSSEIPIGDNLINCNAAAQLEVFAGQAIDLADLVVAGQLGFFTAIDAALEAAETDGLVAAVGERAVEATLAAAFAYSRRPL
jgi:hypothetical protein